MVDRRQPVGRSKGCPRSSIWQSRGLLIPRFTVRVRARAPAFELNFAAGQHPSGVSHASCYGHVVSDLEGVPAVQRRPGQEAAHCARRINLLSAPAEVRPHLFAGFATLPTPTLQAASHELYRAVRELGLVGAMLFLRTGDARITHAELRPHSMPPSSSIFPLYLDPQVATRPGSLGWNSRDRSSVTGR